MRKAGGFCPGASEPADPRTLTCIENLCWRIFRDVVHPEAFDRGDSRVFYKFYNEIVSQWGGKTIPGERSLHIETIIMRKICHFILHKRMHMV